MTALSGRYVLGYDARRLWEPRFSTAGERHAFLFRPDVDRVASVDPVTWPSVFDADGEARPQHVGFFQQLWQDLDALRGHLVSRAEARTRPASIVAVVLCAEILAAADARRWEERLRGRAVGTGPAPEAEPPLPLARPGHVEAGWSLLGYDVCDEWGLSGLSNCGLEPGREDVAALRAKWGPLLNRAHLFDSRDAAAAFAHASDARVEEHAPFFVYELWRVEERSG